MEIARLFSTQFVCLLFFSHAIEWAFVCSSRAIVWFHSCSYAWYLLQATLISATLYIRIRKSCVQTHSHCPGKTEQNNWSKRTILVSVSSTGVYHLKSDNCYEVRLRQHYRLITNFFYLYFDYSAIEIYHFAHFKACLHKWHAIACAHRQRHAINAGINKYIIVVGNSNRKMICSIFTCARNDSSEVCLVAVDPNDDNKSATEKILLIQLASIWFAQS